MKLTLQNSEKIKQFESELEEHLLLSLRAENTQAQNGPINLAVRDTNGELIAGLSGSTSYGWLHVHMMWVAEVHRRQGYARQLLNEAFALARDRGCHSAWLDTSSPSAHVAWTKMGFCDFGCLANAPDQHPKGHQRRFMQRSLPLEPL